mgnify:CR=1 FL=1
MPLHFPIILVKSYSSFACVDHVFHPLSNELDTSFKVLILWRFSIMLCFSSPMPTLYCATATCLRRYVNYALADPSAYMSFASMTNRSNLFFSYRPSNSVQQFCNSEFVNSHCCLSSSSGQKSNLPEYAHTLLTLVFVPPVTFFCLVVVLAIVQTIQLLHLLHPAI